MMKKRSNIARNKLTEEDKEIWIDKVIKQNG